jgi:single-strand DNA-binding protein
MGANLNFNQVILAGRITADVECKTTTTGKSVASFTIAVNGRNNDTTFINCQAWEKTAELVANHFKKGASIMVVGSLQVRSWNDNNGNKRYATEVLVDRVYFVDSRSDSQNAPQSTETRNPYQVPNLSSKIDMSDIKTDTDQDLPF